MVGVGQQVVFRCQDPTAAAIGWKVNGSDVVGSNPLPGITTGLTSDGNGNLYILTIVARSHYNQTEVVCVAFSSGPGGSTETAPVSLLIQSVTQIH